MTGIVRLEQYFSTEKQRQFEYDFLKDMEDYEVWDEIEIGKEYDGQRTYTIEEEDIISYSRAINDKNPIFNDSSAAKSAGFKALVAHPIFQIAIGFWCVGKGPGSWIRSPGSMNPGQKMIIHEPLLAGETISLKIKAYDKWVRRNMYYVTYQLEFLNGAGILKCTWWCTLIVPPSRDVLMSYSRENVYKIK